MGWTNPRSIHIINGLRKYNSPRFYEDTLKTTDPHGHMHIEIMALTTSEILDYVGSKGGLIIVKDRPKAAFVLPQADDILLKTINHLSLPHGSDRVVYWQISIHSFFIDILSLYTITKYSLSLLSINHLDSISTLGQEFSKSFRSLVLLISYINMPLPIRQTLLIVTELFGGKT